MERKKGSNIVVLFFLFISSCVTIGPITKPEKSEDIFKKFLEKYDTSHATCGGWEIEGTMHVVSKTQGFRGKFYICGNENYPWVMELRWGFGTLLSITKIMEHEIVSYNIKQGCVCRFKNPSKIFYTLGLDMEFSPDFYLNLLTGKWRKIIKNFKQVVKLPHGVEFVVDNEEVATFYIKDSLDEWKLVLKNGVVIKGNDTTKFRIIHKSKGNLIFNIKKLSCLKDPFESSKLELKIPSNVEVYEIK